MANACPFLGLNYMPRYSVLWLAQYRVNHGTCLQHSAPQDATFCNTFGHTYVCTFQPLAKSICVSSAFSLPCAASSPEPCTGILATSAAQTPVADSSAQRVCYST